MASIYNASAATNEVAGETASELAKLIQVMISKIPLWIAAFIVIIFSFALAKIVRNIVESKLADKIEEEHQEVQILGGRMSYVIILTIGVTIGLKIAGIDLTSIIAAIAFGVGFALKDMIMNFLAGVMILVGRHFSIGDFINIGGTSGKVVEIQSRVTVLQAFDGTKVIVPNSELFQKQVTSFTSNPFRRIEIIVRVGYRSNIENVMKVAMKVVKGTKGVLASPAPAVLVDQFAESSINLKIRAWTESRGGWMKIKSKLITDIKKEFDKYGIVIPFPLRTIVYDKDIEYAEKVMEEEKIERAVVQEAVQPVPAQATMPTPQITQSGHMVEQPLRPISEQR